MGNKIARAQKVFSLKEQGLSENEIAKKLGVSTRTVRRDIADGMQSVALTVRKAKDTIAELSTCEANEPYIESQVIRTVKQMLLTRVTTIINNIEPCHLGQVSQLLKTLNEMQGGEQRERSSLSDALRGLQQAQSLTDAEIVD